MADFIYPSAVELQQIEQVKLPRLMEGRPVFGIFPLTNVDSHILEWDQRDNFLGLQQLRGLDGEPARVKRVGEKRYLAQPGVYGEYIDINETELTARRRIGTFGVPADIADLVLRAQDQLLQRRLDRIELIAWTLLATGTFSVSAPTGIVHTDTYSPQTVSGAVAWATVATATPLADFRTCQLKGRGISAIFNASARAYMNRATANAMLSNLNANDLGGRRLAGLQPVNTITATNVLLAGEDLPSVEVYDMGYLDDSGSFQLFIPNNKVVVVGNRPGGQRVGEYRLTRNAQNPSMAPGTYTKVVDDPDDVPRRIQVHDGHNGGPVMYFPSSVIILTV